jgi:hypothetical protein
MHDPQFEYRKLYTQEAAAENSYVRSSVYAMMWVYPGASSKTTSRARITIATGIQRPEVETTANQTIIELWKETGWILLEEVFDDSLYNTEGPEEAEDICLKYLESFLLGIPSTALENAEVIKEETKPVKPKKPVKPVISAKKSSAKKESWDSKSAKNKLEKALSTMKKMNKLNDYVKGDSKDKKDKEPKPDKEDK